MKFAPQPGQLRLIILAGLIRRQQQVLGEIGNVFMLDIILRWHRQLVAELRDNSDRRATAEHPRIKPEAVELVPRLARENPR